jgi:Protein of unknown function (DUF1353)
MGKFLDRLVLSPLSDGVMWFLDRRFRYETSDGTLIEVPARFETDFASVPRFFTNILPRWSTYGPAAVIHDWLYWSKTTDRKRADDILLEAMRELQVSDWKRWVIYHGVRWGGWYAWRDDAGLKKRGIDRLHPEDATWPAAPTWKRRSLFRFRFWKSSA